MKLDHVELDELRIRPSGNRPTETDNSPLRVHSVKDTTVWQKFNTLLTTLCTQCGSKCESQSGHSVVQCGPHSVHIVIHSVKLEHFLILWYTLCPTHAQLPQCETHSYRSVKHTVTTV